MVIHNARPVSIVPGWFLCFFFQDSRLVFHGFRWVFWLFKVLVWLFMVSCWFLYFSRFQVGFSWCQVSFHGFSRFQVDFSWFKVVFHGFFYGSRSGFHDSRWILPSLMVPGWFKSELSAGGAK